MYVPWQLNREIGRIRLEDTARASRYAYRTASRRRPRRIASTLRKITEWIGQAGTWRGKHAREPVTRTPTDVTLSVVEEVPPSFTRLTPDAHTANTWQRRQAS